MNIFLLLTIYIVLIIIEIIILIKACKNNSTKLWNITFLIEFTSLLSSIILTIYYESAPGSGFIPGLYYLVHWLFSFGAGVIFAIILFITICIKITKFEMNLKRQNKYYSQPFYLILAILFIFAAITFLGYEIINNWDIKKSQGTVISFENEIYTIYNPQTGIRQERVVQQPVVEFIVNDITYTDTSYYIDNVSVGDTVNICFAPHVNDGYYITRPANMKLLYISLFLFAFLIIFIRFRKR